MRKHNSEAETWKHILTVRQFLYAAMNELIQRVVEHDQSKLLTPEVEVFDEFTSKLAGTTYGSEEYEAARKAMKPALDHHYANNRHHPEHFPDGIAGMNLIDVLEMLCDWKAATLRHNDGDIRVSLEVNQKRYGYSDEFKRLLANTLPLLEKR